MTSNERKNIARCLMHLKAGIDNPAAAARGLSAIYRSTRTTRTQQFVFETAKQYGLHTHPDFRI